MASMLPSERRQPSARQGYPDENEKNRYYLSLWDVRKLPLYGRARESVQVATLNLASFGRRQTLVHRSAVAIPEHWALDRLNS